MLSFFGLPFVSGSGFYLSRSKTLKLQFGSLAVWVQLSFSLGNRPARSVIQYDKD